MDDVQELVDERYPEGAFIEYKRCLPGKKKPNDAWAQDKKILEGARDELLAEVIAFANAHGGTLIIGIEESDDDVPEADKLTPVPSCKELALKLTQQARSCIDPVIPLLDAVGIPSDASSQDGIVVIRVGRSYLAPHRLRGNRQCYVRRQDRTETMDMREIQDLTLQTERGTARIDRILSQRSEGFRDELDRLSGQHELRAGARVTALPVWPLRAERVSRNREIFPEFEAEFNCRIGNDPLVLKEPPRPNLERPIVRGSRRVYQANTSYCSLVQEMHCDGLAEIRFSQQITGEGELYVDACWILVSVANVLIMAERFRQHVGAGEVEFALEVELAMGTDPLNLRDLPEMQVYWTAELARRPTYEMLPLVDLPPFCFPKMSVGSRDRFDGLLAQFYVDLLNAGGLHTETPHLFVSWPWLDG